MKKKISVLLIVLLLAFGFILNANTVKADSGFDFSYDSSSSSDYDSNDDLEGEPFDIHNPVHLGALILGISVTLFVIGAVIHSYTSKDKLKAKEIEGSKNKLKEYNIDYNSLVNELAKDYTEIQKAWMNFDYDTLRGLLTDELYNNYVTQLETLKTKEEKNMMENVRVKEISILYVKEENDYLVVAASLKVEQQDYIINSKGDVVRGSRLDLNEVEYTITFVKPLSIKDSKCPNCGASLDNNIGKCPNCRTTIIKQNDKFVMSKKTIINQRRI